MPQDFTTKLSKKDAASFDDADLVAISSYAGIGNGDGGGSYKLQKMTMGQLKVAIFADAVASVYANNADAITGGLAVGDFYHTVTGTVRVVV